MFRDMGCKFSDITPDFTTFLVGSMSEVFTHRLANHQETFIPTEGEIVNFSRVFRSSKVLFELIPNHSKFRIVAIGEISHWIRTSINFSFFSRTSNFHSLSKALNLYTFPVMLLLEFFSGLLKKEEFFPFLCMEKMIRFL